MGAPIKARPFSLSLDERVSVSWALANAPPPPLPSPPPPVPEQGGGGSAPPAPGIPAVDDTARALASLAQAYWREAETTAATEDADVAGGGRPPRGRPAWLGRGAHLSTLGGGPYASAPWHAGGGLAAADLASWATVAETDRANAAAAAAAAVSGGRRPSHWVAPSLPGPPPPLSASSAASSSFALRSSDAALAPPPPPAAPEPPLALLLETGAILRSHLHMHDPDEGGGGGAATDPSFGQPAGGGIPSAVSEKTFQELTSDLQGRCVRELVPALTQAGSQAIADALLPAVESWLVPRLVKAITAELRGSVRAGVLSAGTARLAGRAPQAMTQAISVDTQLIPFTACSVAAATAAALTHTLSWMPEDAHFDALCAESGLYCPWAKATTEVTKRRLAQAESFAAYFAADAATKYMVGLTAQRAAAAAIGGSALARTATGDTGLWSIGDRQRGWRGAAGPDWKKK